jgi:uncharacterized RmlC-like cupin family protein
MKAMERERQPEIRIVGQEEFSPGTSQTAGSLRLAAISAETGVSSAIWGGTFLVEPGARTGIHHHGAQDTIAYVLDGSSLVRWGIHGEHERIAHAGEFLHIAGGLLHQEINPSATEPFRWIVVRSTPEPIVVNFPDSIWP